MDWVAGIRRGGENRFADFGTEIPAVLKRIRHVFQSGELEREATVSEMVRPLIWKEIIFIYSIPVG